MARRALIALAALIATPAFADDGAATPCETSFGCARLNPAEVILVADRYHAAGRSADAETLLEGLSREPDVEIRTEARFRLASMRERRGDLDGAVGSLRALLVDKPDAARPRLELARLLARIGDERGARRELRMASATGLPEDVERAVDRFAHALRATQPFGGSFELAIAPDSNINRATARDRIDTVIAPLELSEDAQARSGVGVALGGQAYWRLGLGERSALLTRFTARGDLYGDGRFNDVGANLSIGPELRIGSARIRPAAVASRRWFGGTHYSDSLGGSVNLLRPIDRASQIEVDATILSNRFPGVAIQNGILADATIAYDRALSSRASARISARATRQSASDPGLSSTAYGAELIGSRLVAGQVLFAQAGISRLEGDARLALFPERRRDLRLDIGGGLVLRGLTINGLSPLVRVVRTINRSTVDIYDHARTRVEFGLSRAF